MPAPTRRCSVSSASSPMSATCTLPAWKRPGATMRPTLRPWKVTVVSARTATPATSPVDASTPEGRSTASTRAADALMRSINAAASGLGSPEKPVPKSASTITSGSPSSDSPAFASTTRTSLPACCSSRAAIRPSPPFAPPPHTTVQRSARGCCSRPTRAVAFPARSISSSTLPAYCSSAVRISAEEYKGSSSGIAHHRDGLRELARVRHREVDGVRPDVLGPGGDAPGETHRRLRTAHDLDVLPRECPRDAEAECLADRLLAGEAPGVALRRIRPRVAVGLLGGGEASIAEAAVPVERAPHALDLDQVCSHPYAQRCSSSQSG